MNPLLFIILTVFASHVVANPLKDFLKCATETEPGKSFRSGIMGSFDISHGLECFSSCLMKAIGVLDINGKISPDGIMNIVQNSTDSVAIGKGRVVVLRCGMIANAKEETCETILTFNKCIQEAVWDNSKSRTLPEFNITLPPITLVFAFLSLL